jgi:Mrp family chromosome partitioning ATPase
MKLKREKKKIAGVLKSEGISKQYLVFLNQFKWLKLDDQVRAAKAHDFYLGDEPTWSDMLTDKDAIFEIVGSVLDVVNVSFANNRSRSKQFIFNISGLPGSGKSASVLRIARELTKNGHDVFIYRGESRLDIESITWRLKQFCPNHKPKNTVI